VSLSILLISFQHWPYPLHECFVESFLTFLDGVLSSVSSQLHQRVSEDGVQVRYHPDFIKVRLKVGKDEFDDLIAYNETLDFIQDDFEVTDGVDTLYGVKNMLDLCGQSSERKEDPTNRMKTYDGSTWNILIKWSSGEYSWKPNTIYMAADVAECTESLEVDQLQKHHLFVICGYPPPAGYRLIITLNTCRDDFLDTELMTTTAATTKYNQR
jgi:hypothetical protein